MQPDLALIVWAVLIAALLYFDPARTDATSWALWIPIGWFFIVASRLPSQWIGGETGLESNALTEGNALDRTVFLCLIVLSIGILLQRRFRWAEFVANNQILTLFVLFTLLSVTWSDFPFVAFKRWIRDLGNYLVILIILSDPNPLEAFRAVLRRLSYVLITLTVLLIKYFRDIGMQYNAWTGSPMYLGPTTGKNLLGVICLLSGLFFVWDSASRWREHSKSANKRVLVVNFVFLGMTLWLTYLANSATSRVCLAFGSAIILLSHTRIFRNRPILLKIGVPLSLCLYAVMAFGFDMNGSLAAAVGRDPTLTDRTEIWQIVTSVGSNPLVGTGYDSFWLGQRLQTIWQSSAGMINESHNGYLEIYLNLGIIGLAIVSVFLISSYGRMCKNLMRSTSLGSFAIALWAVALLYNVTEAAFKWHLVWLMLLMATMVLPDYSEFRATENADEYLPDGEEESWYDDASCQHA